MVYLIYWCYGTVLLMSYRGTVVRDNELSRYSSNIPPRPLDDKGQTEVKSEEKIRVFERKERFKPMREVGAEKDAS